MDTYFYSWETVDLVVTLEDPTKLQNYSTVLASIRQGYRHIEVSLDITVPSANIDTGSGTIIIHLTQANTGLFSAGQATLQINIYRTDTTRDTSEEELISVRENLYKQVMS